MALLSVSKIRLSGIAASVPSQTVLNKELKGFSKKEKDLLIKTTGIHSRRIAPEHINASDLCLKAAQELIAKLSWDKDAIDILIFVSQTPDHTIPGSSMQLQNRLGLSASCIALDINLGCSGYVYGLSVITSMMAASQIKKGLLLVGDTITHTLAPDDKSTVPIFSDAGSATAIEFDATAPDMFFNLQTDGSGYDMIIKKKGDFLKMNGLEVFHFGLKEVASNLNTLETHYNIDSKTIDYYIFHQANMLLNEALRRKLKLDKEKVPYTLMEYGNTSCATIPLTIVHSLQQKIETQDLKLILSGFGVGMSWGSSMIEVSNVICPKLIEVE